MKETRFTQAATLRFALVGVAATATYFAVAMLLIGSRAGFDPVLASALASGTATLVSYAGHHRYTFVRKGRHRFYFPRFVAITGALFLLSTMAMYVFTHMIPIDPRYVAGAITVSYPIASYVLNFLWVFK